MQGDGKRAGRAFVESLEAAPQGGGHFVVPPSLEGIAGVLSLRQQAEHGAVLLGAAEALREAIEHARPPIERTFYDKICADIQAQLEAEVLQRAWQRGRQLSAVQAIAEAKSFIYGSIPNIISNALSTLNKR